MENPGTADERLSVIIRVKVELAFGKVSVRQTSIPQVLQSRQEILKLARQATVHLIRVPLRESKSYLRLVIQATTHLQRHLESWHAASAPCRHAACSCRAGCMLRRTTGTPHVVARWPSTRTNLEHVSLWPYPLTLKVP